MKKSKKVSILLGVLICICLLIAGCNSAAEPDAEMAEQEQFLEDMAQGITNRQNKGDVDTTSMTREELAAHYEKLIDCELDQIQKYEEKTFADDKFDALAHLYISACEMQYEATQNYKNDELFMGLWEGGRTGRSGLICTFYDQYDLPISSEQVAVYRSAAYSAGTEVEYSVSGDDDFFDFINQGGDDIVLSVGDLMVVDTKVTFDKGYSSEFDRYAYSFTVRNNSSYDLESVSIDCVITDMDGNLLGSDALWIHNTLPSGKTAVMEGGIYLTDYTLPICIVPDKFAYDGNGDSVVYEVEADATNAEEYTIKLAAGSGAAAESEKATYSLEIGNICEECGKTASKTYVNPFSGITEYYCKAHYDEITGILSKMEEDVGKSSQSKHTCMECSKEGTHTYSGFTGQTEYYCTEHYEELMSLLDAFGIG